MLTLRFDGESDDQFRAGAERALRVAKMLVTACLSNRCMLRYVADPSLPYTEESVRVSPTVRVEYEQAIAIGDLGTCLSATASKRWGDGPWVMPLEPDDEFFPDRVTYIYRANSLYNRRFEQRRGLKELLGKRLRPGSRWPAFDSVEFAVLQEFLAQRETSRLDASRHDVLPMFGSDETPEVAGIGGSHDHAAFAEHRCLSGQDDVRIQCQVMSRGWLTIPSGPASSSTTSFINHPPRADSRSLAVQGLLEQGPHFFVVA